MNLPAPSGPRFSIDEYTAWPAEHGDAHVCLWADDKTAVLTITIDDNHEEDHAFWKKMQDTYGTVCTWFAITNNITDWTAWNELADRGHDIQSHTESHYSSSGTAADFEREYGGSITAIEANIPGHRCLTLAYPNGTAHIDYASQYFIAARGVYGTMNNANTINYLNLNSGGYNDTSRIDVLLDPSKLLWNTSYYRGWSSVHYHPVGDSLGKAMTEKYCRYVHQHRDELWVAGFSKVAAYGQSRDTHILTMGTITSEEIRFTLTDEMNDAYFYYPLTVKVRVGNEWQNAAAVQNGTQRSVSMVSHDGKQYALVQAVPDKGEVILTKSDPSGMAPVIYHNNRQGVVLPRYFNLSGCFVPVSAVSCGIYFGYNGGLVSSKILIIN